MAVRKGLWFRGRGAKQAALKFSKGKYRGAWLTGSKVERVAPYTKGWSMKTWYRIVKKGK